MAFGSYKDCDTGLCFLGAVWVFRRTGNAWVEKQSLLDLAQLEHNSLCYCFWLYLAGFLADFIFRGVFPGKIVSDKDREKVTKTKEKLI